MARTVRDVLRRDFIRVSPDDAPEDVLRIMTMARVRTLPVVAAGRIRGFVDHRDLALAALGLGSGAQAAFDSIASFVRPARPVSPEAPLPEAARQMIGEQLPCLVAADEDDGSVLGLVTETDLLRAAYGAPRPSARDDR
jgi:CBS domain-containing protein